MARGRVESQRLTSWPPARLRAERVRHTRRRAGRSCACWPPRYSWSVLKEGLDVSGELRVVLEQEPVRRVRVKLHAGLRDQAREQVGVMRQDHRVAVAVRHE